MHFASRQVRLVALLVCYECQALPVAHAAEVGALALEEEVHSKLARASLKVLLTRSSRRFPGRYLAPFHSL
jgi:hypothetical protein